MSDTTEETRTLTLQPLETPPRTTGNAQMDFPLIIDWMYRLYQVMLQAVNFINNQVTQNPDVTLNDLPDPATSTVAQAQETANQAYTLAAAQKTRIDGFISGSFTITDTADTATVTFADAQADSSYRVMVQATGTTGTPDDMSYVLKSKTYGTADFSVTLVAAPGLANSVTFDWQLIRNS